MQFRPFGRFRDGGLYSGVGIKHMPCDAICNTVRTQKSNGRSRYTVLVVLPTWYWSTKCFTGVLLLDYGTLLVHYCSIQYSEYTILLVWFRENISYLLRLHYGVVQVLRTLHVLTRYKSTPTTLRSNTRSTCTAVLDKVLYLL